MAKSEQNAKKLFIKTFLATGLLFGFLMALWDYIKDKKIDIEKIIFISIIFGALMAWRSVAFRKNKNPDK